MKKGWQVKHLGDVAEVGAGNSAPQAESLFKNGTHPFFRTSDAGRVRFGDIYESADFLNEQGINKLRRYPKGTILFPKSGASTFLNHRVMLGVEGYVSSHLATVIADESEMNPRFLLYFLSTIAAQDLIQDHAYPSLNLPLIAEIKIPVPPLQEQKRIVAILDEVFEGIATAKANTAKNLQNARAIFESHLDSVFSQRGPGWQSKALEKTCIVFTDGDWIESKDQSSGGIRLIQTGNIGIGFFKNRANKARYISEATFKRLRCTEIFKGDCLISRLPDPVGRSCILPETGERMITAVDCTIARFDAKQVISEFFVYFSQTTNFLESVKSQTTGTTRNRISRGKLGQITIPVAPLSEQKRLIVELDLQCGETQRLAALYEQKIAMLEAIKSSFLYKAFSGEL